MEQPASSPLTLFPPPYRDFLPLDPRESYPRDPSVLLGTALVWRIGRRQGERVVERVTDRPAGLPLMVILPRADELARVEKRVLKVAESARPQSVLPHHDGLTPDEMAALLRREPPDLAAEFVDYLQWRGLMLDQDTRRLIRRTVELSSELTTLSALARGLYLSRRALGRRFKKRGLPVPSHWLQFCRLLRAILRLQNSRASLFDVACSLGYPDGFTLSNQMDRLVGVRPSDARIKFGWEWFVESWLQREWETGGLRIVLARRSAGTDSTAAESTSDPAAPSTGDPATEPTEERKASA